MPKTNTSPVLNFVINASEGSGPIKIPASLINRNHACDRVLIDKKALVKAKEHLDTIDCPLGCGESEQVSKEVSKGIHSYFVRCSCIGEYRRISPADVEFYTLDKNKFQELVDSGVIQLPKNKNALFAQKASEYSHNIAPTTKPRKYDKSKTKDWTQKKAAKMLGISDRQLRSYKTNPPDAHWPGWEDPIALRQWINQREDRDLMAQAISNALPYRETKTERAMRK